MLVLALICWVILLQQAIGKVDAFFSTLSTSDTKVQEEIVEKFNEIGRNVEATTGNILKIIWNPEAARNARSWAEQCTFTTSPSNERTIKNASCNEVYYMSTSPRLWLDIIHLWYSTLTKLYSTVTEFQYGTRVMNASPLNPYNQMVKVSSHQIGCAFAFCPERKFEYFYVCHSCPLASTTEIKQIPGSPNTPYAKAASCAECPVSCDKGLCTDPCILGNIFYSSCSAYKEKIMNSTSANQITGPSAPKPASSFSFFSTHNTSVQMEIVNKHNELRRMTNPSAANILKMAWNKEAALNAENWGKKCILSHSPGQKRKISFAGCGENIYMSTAIKPWSDVIQDFYNEVKDFRYGYGPTKKAAIGHYTQLVWATSHQLGCALTRCLHKKFQYFYVCHYCPAGNIKRPDRPDALYKPYKQGKACSDCPDHCDNGLCTNPCMHVDRYTNCPELAKSTGCDNNTIKEICQATCKCLTEIK